MRRVAAVVLAAGASSRLGQSKQLLRLGGETLLERAVRVVREAGCAPVAVVLGASAAEVLAGGSLGDALVVVNEEWREGMGASVRAGVAALSGWEIAGCVVMTCDQPAVSAAHLRKLMAAGEVTASGYAGRRGVPAYFPAAMFGELMELKGDVGARELLKEAGVVQLVGGELDVDTVEDLEKVRKMFGG